MAVNASPVAGLARRPAQRRAMLPDGRLGPIVLRHESFDQTLRFLVARAARRV